jgi:hypothetical protein
MTPAEQNRETRILRIKAQYPGKVVEVTEVDNWGGLMSTQIRAMKARNVLPEQYSYHIEIKGDA